MADKLIVDHISSVKSLSSTWWRKYLHLRSQSHSYPHPLHLGILVRCFHLGHLLHHPGQMINCLKWHCLHMCRWCCCLLLYDSRPLALLSSDCNTGRRCRRWSRSGSRTEASTHQRLAIRRTGWICFEERETRKSCRWVHDIMCWWHRWWKKCLRKSWRCRGTMTLNFLFQLGSSIVYNSFSYLRSLSLCRFVLFHFCIKFLFLSSLWI